MSLMSGGRSRGVVDCVLCVETGGKFNQLSGNVETFETRVERHGDIVAMIRFK